MTSKTIAEGILRALGVILAIVILLAFLYKISAVLIYIARAGVASLIGRPIVLFFRQKLKFNNTVAVIITMIFL
ncbi:MAG: AI-2E family transporter, partial [Arenibacter sp.]